MTGPGGPRAGTAARQGRLMALLHDGHHHVEDLASRLSVSSATVRRDLAQLTREGRVARTYGGAISRSAFQERSVDDSADVRSTAKAAISRAAAELASEGSIIFLDAGTTCVAVAERLFHRSGLTVVTRGLETASALASSRDVTVMLVGGTVRPLSHGLVGPFSEIALSRLRFDIAFLGADAVDPSRGIGEPTIEETHVKEAAARSSTTVVVLADSSKLSGTRPPAWTDLDRRWSLITDEDVAPDSVALYETHGVPVTVAR